jgi:hypothetical protein
MRSAAPWSDIYNVGRQANCLRMTCTTLLSTSRPNRLRWRPIATAVGQEVEDHAPS